tara:strand:+ start:4159 stop:4521 length:363 start_codon:yes stop_codon:yes gene_type:complete
LPETFPSIATPDYAKSDSLGTIHHSIGEISITDTPNILVTLCMIDNLILAVGMFFLYSLIYGYYLVKDTLPFVEKSNPKILNVFRLRTKNEYLKSSLIRITYISAEQRNNFRSFIEKIEK